MSGQVTIVMYHYIRELTHSRYPEIKGLEIHKFKEQLAYILKYYHIITASELLAAVDSAGDLPRNAALLTFDDGYVDHYTNVFPIIEKHKIQGCFFPPPAAIMKHKVLDVNKIHFILAAIKDKSSIIKKIFSMMDELRAGYSLRSNADYYAEFAVANRFDPAPVAFIKRLLQTELPECVRSMIIDDLFSSFVTSDEQAFSQELYMSVDQLQCLQRHGMYIGSHGYNHYWLDHLDGEKQEEEINSSLEFLKILGGDVNKWIMCYPYGVYNESLLDLLKRKGCQVGLTTRVDLARLDLDNPLTLPRLDTNDLPKKGDARPNDWTLQAAAAS